MTLRPLKFALILVAATIAPTFIAAPVHAESKRDKGGQKLLEQARRNYNLGHFPEALAAFEKAYEDSGDSALLFNLAETHRQLGHNGDALRLYNAYLRELPNGPEHEAAAAEIKSLTGGGASAKSPPPPTTPPPPVATAPRPAPPPPAPPPPPPPPPRVSTAPAKPAPAPAPAPAKPAPAAPPPANNPWPPPAATAPPPPATNPPPASPAPVAPIVTVAPGATPPPGATAPGPESSPLLVTQPPPPAAHRSKVPVIIGAAVTGALAASAIAFTLSSNNLYDELQSSCGVTPMGCTQGQVDGVKTRDHAATAFWIAAGAAAIATSVLLIVRF